MAKAEVLREGYFSLFYNFFIHSTAENLSLSFFFSSISSPQFYSRDSGLVPQPDSSLQPKQDLGSSTIRKSLMSSLTSETKPRKKRNKRYRNWSRILEISRPLNLDDGIPKKDIFKMRNTLIIWRSTCSELFSYESYECIPVARSMLA